MMHNTCNTVLAIKHIQNKSVRKLTFIYGIKLFSEKFYLYSIMVKQHNYFLGCFIVISLDLMCDMAQYLKKMNRTTDEDITCKE